jgi:hypothetical protein
LVSPRLVIVILPIPVSLAVSLVTSLVASLVGSLVTSLVSLIGSCVVPFYADRCWVDTPSVLLRWLSVRLLWCAASCIVVLSIGPVVLASFVVVWSAGPAFIVLLSIGPVVLVLRRCVVGWSCLLPRSCVCICFHFLVWPFSGYRCFVVLAFLIVGGY